MCLIVNKAQTEFFFEKYKNTSRLYAYKVIRIHMGLITSPFFTNYLWNPGIHVANRTTNRINAIKRTTISRGFHAYFNNAYAAEIANSLANCRNYRTDTAYKVVKLIVKPEDIIAVSSFDKRGTLVFSKCNLTAKEYNKVLQSHNN